MKKQTLLLLMMVFIFPALSLANGGDQRVVENKYLINLSRAPFTPKVGVKTSFLASFVDIQKNKLINEELIVSIRISKLGDAPKGKFIFEQDNIAVKGGVLEFSYTFNEAVLYEIFFDFAFASNPEKAYNAPDFLLDIQKQGSPEKGGSLFLIAIISALIGGIAGFLIGRKVKTPL
jgi:hypothetical protein